MDSKDAAHELDSFGILSIVTMAEGLRDMGELYDLCMKQTGQDPHNLAMAFVAAVRHGANLTKALAHASGMSVLEVGDMFIEGNDWQHIVSRLEEG